MDRKKIAYKNARGERCIGYASLDTDSEYVFVRDDKYDLYGDAIHRNDIIKVY